MKFIERVAESLVDLLKLDFLDRFDFLSEERWSSGSPTRSSADHSQPLAERTMRLVLGAFPTDVSTNTR